MLLTQVIRGAAITGRTDVVSTRLLGRQGGRWAQQWVDSALPEAARRTPGAPPPPPRAPAPPPDAATAARVLEDLHRRGLLTDAELARLRAARGI